MEVELSKPLKRGELNDGRVALKIQYRYDELKLLDQAISLRVQRDELLAKLLKKIERKEEKLREQESSSTLERSILSDETVIVNKDTLMPLPVTTMQANVNTGKKQEHHVIEDMEQEEDEYFRHYKNSAIKLA